MELVDDLLDTAGITAGFRRCPKSEDFREALTATDFDWEQGYLLTLDGIGGQDSCGILMDLSGAYEFEFRKGRVVLSQIEEKMVAQDELLSQTWAVLTEPIRREHLERCIAEFPL